MDEGRVKDGVEKRAKSIRLHFDYLGKRRRETLKILPTPNNLKYARKKRAQIRFEIESGAFNYAAHFPNSKNAHLGRAHDARTVAEFHAVWLSTLNIERSTLRGYTSSYQRYIKPTFGERAIDSIVLSELKTWRVDLVNRFSPKTVNNALVVFRGILKCAYGDEAIRRDLANQVDNVTVPTDKTHVDPFEVAEIHALVESLLKRRMEAQANLIQFWFCAGLRPGEIMALRWEDIDWVGRKVRIQRNWVMKQNKATKTRNVRDIDMLGHAYDALQRQRKHSQMADAWVFPNPTTGEQWSRDDILRVNFQSWCKVAGVRRRPPKQLRHTYGSMMLSAGEPPLYVMEQMGHTSLQMLERHYAKWMRSANRAAGSAFSDLARS